MWGWWWLLPLTPHVCPPFSLHNAHGLHYASHNRYYYGLVRRCGWGHMGLRSWLVPLAWVSLMSNSWHWWWRCTCSAWTTRVSSLDSSCTFVCLFVCGISFTSGQLVSELFPDCTRSCFSQVVLRRRGGDRIYEMRRLFVAVGPNARFIVLPHWDNMS